MVKPEKFTVDRYSTVAVLLHWLIAVAILAAFGLGLWMHEAGEDPATRAQAAQLALLHMSTGLAVLVLSLVRIGWRIIHPVPPFPLHMRRWERWLARGTHTLFYFLMIVIPLVGWAIISVSPRGQPVNWFGLFDWPLLPLQGVTDGAEAAGQLGEVHELLAWLMIALFAIHVAAALKHHFLDRDRVFTRMAPWIKARS